MPRISMSIRQHLSFRTISICGLVASIGFSATSLSAQSSGGCVRLQNVQSVKQDVNPIWTKAIFGDWVADAEIISAGEPPEMSIAFATQPNSQQHLSFKITSNETELVRHAGTGETKLAVYTGAGPLPWKVRIRRRGAYYFFEVNGAYLGFSFHPSGDLDRSSLTGSVVEPSSTRLGVQFLSDGKHELRDFRLQAVEFGQRSEIPVIAPGPSGSWDQAEAFPGAIIKYKQTYYLYLNGTDWTSKSLEGGGHTRVGLATSEDLIHWKVDPNKIVLDLGPKNAWDSTLVMVNGATQTPAGKFAITYMGFNGKTWSGIGLALADNPAGPFTRYDENPVLRTVPNSWETSIHEHTLYYDGSRYVLFYTGFDGNKGDRGGLAYSNDLIHWTKDSANPVFVDEGPNRWSSLHLRPRSLLRHKDYFYLFYEGAGMRPKFSEGEGGVEVSNKLVFDSVGLARSLDLHHWEMFPLNPAIPQTGERSFDALWTGWPHAVSSPGGLSVFYAGSDAWGFAKKQGRVFAGLIHFPYEDLENWGRITDANSCR